MQNQPIFIGTSRGIINVSTINCVAVRPESTLVPYGKKFGIRIDLNNPDADICLYDDEAYSFIRKLGLINWIPGTSSWVSPQAQGGNNG